MKLDINLLDTLNAEKEQLEKELESIYRANRGVEFNEFYRANREVLREKHDRIDEITTEMIIIKATNIQVGDGISLSPYTDWNAFTVIERRETPKGFVLTIQEDEAIRTDHNGMSDSQSYEFRRDPNGRIWTVKWNSRSRWFSADGYKVALGRHCYYDYSF